MTFHISTCMLRCMLFSHQCTMLLHISMTWNMNCWMLEWGQLVLSNECHCTGKKSVESTETSQQLTHYLMSSTLVSDYFAKIIHKWSLSDSFPCRYTCVSNISIKRHCWTLPTFQMPTKALIFESSNGIMHGTQSQPSIIFPEKKNRFSSHCRCYLTSDHMNKSPQYLSFA